MALPYSFTSNTSPTGAQLDDDLAALGALTIIACAISGTNTLALAPNANTPTVSAYANYMTFVGRAANANSTGGVTANVGAVGALNVYKDSAAGPAVLTGGEIQPFNLIVLIYDTALDGGSGGFHLLNPAPIQVMSHTTNVTDNAGTTLTAAALTGLSGGVGTRQGIITRGGAPGGDFNDTTDTAIAIAAALYPLVLNSTFRFRVVNSSGHTQTLLAGSNVTVAGTATTADSTTHDFIGVVTNTSTPTVTIYG